MEVDIVNVLERFGLPVVFFLWYILLEKPRQDKRYDAAIALITIASEKCYEKIDLLIKNHFDRIEEVLTKCQK